VQLRNRRVKGEERDDFNSGQAEWRDREANGAHMFHTYGGCPDEGILPETKAWRMNERKADQADRERGKKENGKRW